MNNNHVFSNWQEAAANARPPFDSGEIDLDEYNKILALAKQERASMPMRPGPGQPPPVPGQMASSGQNAPINPSDLGPSASGKAVPLGMPMQSMPSWEQVQKYLREIMGPRPAY